MTRIGRKYSPNKNTIENDAYFSELFRILFAMNTLTVIAHFAWYAPNSFKTAIATHDYNFTVSRHYITNYMNEVNIHGKERHERNVTKRNRTK